MVKVKKTNKNTETRKRFWDVVSFSGSNSQFGIHEIEIQHDLMRL